MCLSTCDLQVTVSAFVIRFIFTFCLCVCVNRFVFSRSRRLGYCMLLLGSSFLAFLSGLDIVFLTIVTQMYPERSRSASSASRHAHEQVESPFQNHDQTGRLRLLLQTNPSRYSSVPCRNSIAGQHLRSAFWQLPWTSTRKLPQGRNRSLRCIPSATSAALTVLSQIALLLSDSLTSLPSSSVIKLRRCCCSPMIEPGRMMRSQPMASRAPKPQRCIM